MLPLFPYAAALLLSESRGAMLTAACASAAVLLWKRQLTAPLLAAGAAPVAAAALLYRQLAPAALAVEPVPGLLLLAGLWAGALSAGLWLCRRSCCAAGRVRAAALVLAAASWTAAGTAVQEQIRGRITGPSPTVSARGLFYRDAWKLAGEAPWLGQGGGTWRSAYLAAQSRPYVGSQVHSGYLDILLNTGIAGLACCLLLLLSAGWLAGRYAPRLLPPVLVIVLHGAVDFDWSYSLVWLLLFLLPALALAGARRAEAGTSYENGPVYRRNSGSARSLFSRCPAFLYPLHQKRLILTARLGLCCLSILPLLLSVRMLMGESLYDQAGTVQEPAMRLQLLRQSLEWNRRQPAAALSLSRLLPAAEAEAVLLGSLLHSPGNAALHWELAERAMKSDNPGEALQWIRKSLQLDVFNAGKRIEAARGMLAMSRQKLLEGKRKEALASAAAGLELLRGYRLLAVQEEHKGAQHNDRLFRITEEAGELELRLRQEMRSAYVM
ncbi:hypothetical protein C2I18_08165 [Paenibacillus sp. PK3_47]|nr:hypothetical protein C2I18_08165 [Paenibacillus sp. PK3_47]